MWLKKKAANHFKDASIYDRADWKCIFVHNQLFISDEENWKCKITWRVPRIWIRNTSKLFQSTTTLRWSAMKAFQNFQQWQFHFWKRPLLLMDCRVLQVFKSMQKASYSRKKYQTADKQLDSFNVVRPYSSKCIRANRGTTKEWSSWRAIL